MKLSARDATAFIKKPDQKMAGALIYGEDSETVGKRKDILAQLLAGEAEDASLSIHRVDTAAARRSSALIADAVRDTGFFGGRRIIILENATDGALEALSRGIEAAAESGGFIIATAGVLPTRSKLRKYFEEAKNAVSAPCYASAPDRRDIEERLRLEGIADISDAALDLLDTLGHRMKTGAFSDLLRQISLYALGSNNPLGAEDVAACAPTFHDESMDFVIDAVLDRKVTDIGPALARLAGQGQAPVGICIGVARAFRMLLSANANMETSGLEAALRSIKPPLFGPRRDAMMRRLKNWHQKELENALTILSETDVALRGGIDGPAYAILGRAFIRISLLK